jgi:hypothetical protein
LDGGGRRERDEELRRVIAEAQPFDDEAGDEGKPFVHDDNKAVGLPAIGNLTYARLELMDNGKRKGKARHTAIIHYSADPIDAIDRYAMPKRYVDFTTPSRFKRTMLNHMAEPSPNDIAWYEAHRKDAMRTAKSDGVSEVLMGHVQVRWFGSDGASKLYRYPRQIAFLATYDDGSKEIFLCRDNESCQPIRKVKREQRNARLRRKSAANAPEAVYYYDPLDYFGERISKRRKQPAPMTDIADAAE